jgi:glucose/arabinose dehydrogenase
LPQRRRMRRSRILLTVALVSSCSRAATLPLDAGIGPNPTLVEPHKESIPTVNIAPAKGWASGATPRSIAGTRTIAFARDLNHPRWLYVLPNGDVLVAETNAPPKPDDGHGIRKWFMDKYFKQAGAAVPSANRVTLLRDTNNDGVADVRTVFLENLHAPFGMTLVGNDFYVANSDALVRYRYEPGTTRITTGATKVVDLPAGTINHHWTKNVIASRDGSKLYVTIGSNSNVAENGMDKEEGRAAIWEVDPRTGAHRIFASGLRNPNGMAWEPETGALWTSVNERDEIGSDLVPDFMTSVKDGGFYGWPYSYYGGTVDSRVQPQRPELVSRAIKPDYALGAHTASLGLTYSPDGSTSLPASLTHGMFVGQHGSWNREPKSGYRVIFVRFANGKPSAAPVEVLTGFLDRDENAHGRPVGVVIDSKGALLVADDVGNVVWRVTRQ